MPLPPFVSRSKNFPAGAVSPRLDDRIAVEAFLTKDLRASAVEINGALLSQEISNAYRSMAAFVYDRKAFNLTLEYGFISRYELLEELTSYIKPTAASGSFQTPIALLARPEAFDSYLKVPTNINSLETGIAKLQLQDFTAGNKAFRRYTVTNKHPYLSTGTILYGVPNYPAVDPRRTGNFLMFNDISDDIFIYLLNNASDYGFMWYGVDKRYWLYNGAIVKAKSDKLKEAFNKLIASNVNVLTDLYI